MSQTTTITQATSSPTFLKVKGTSSFPNKLTKNFDNHAKLSREQCGHLRHFYNIASSLDGDWPFMGAQEPGQEWDTAYRYQLATMTYASGAAHYHRLPAMRSIFKPLIKSLIGKMLRREVWGYWYLTSQGGTRTNPDLKEMRKPWADPVCKENIMYSGHLLLMVSLYTMLFADDTFDQEGSISFDWNPMFWGFGPEKFNYSRKTLQEAILKEMEREKWMGVCCEPNLIFIICNQFPLIAFRYNDASDGTRIIDEVLPKYKAAWAEKQGFVGKGGLFRVAYMTAQKKTMDSKHIAHTVWAMAFMPWNYDLASSQYPSVSYGWLRRIGDRFNINQPDVAEKVKELVVSEGADPNSDATLSRARELVGSEGYKSNLPGLVYMTATFAYLAMWMSEVVGGSDLDALLRHADTFFKPSWYKGGLYYPRNDGTWDSDGNYVFNDSVTGNAGIGYARLNIKGGQKKMWDHPWTKEQVMTKPYIDGLTLASDIDCLRAVWDERERAMVVTLRTWDVSTKSVQLLLHNLPTGRYGLYVNGDLRESAESTASSIPLTVKLGVDGDGVDLVVVHE